MKTVENLAQRFGQNRLGDELLHAAAHGIHQQKLIGRKGRRARDDVGGGLQFANLRGQRQVRRRIAAQVQKNHIGNDSGHLRWPVRMDSPLLNVRHESHLL